MYYVTTFENRLRVGLVFCLALPRLAWREGLMVVGNCSVCSYHTPFQFACSLDQLWNNSNWFEIVARSVLARLGMVCVFARVWLGGHGGGGERSRMFPLPTWINRWIVMNSQ